MPVSRVFRFGRNVAMVSVLALSLAGGALAQASPDMTAMSNRLAQLERQIQTLSRQVSRAGISAAAPATPSGGETVSSPQPGFVAQPAAVPGAPDATMGLSTSVAAGIEVRLTQLEMQMRDLTGKMEESVHSGEQLAKRVDKALRDLDSRLEKAPAPVRPASVAPAQPQAEGSSAPRAVPGSSSQENRPLGTLGDAGDALPEKMYEEAFSQLGRTEYAKAEAGFAKFLSLYADHKLAANAQYWLAESYYVRGQLNEAAVAFAEGFQKYPDAQKAPDNLLKLGMTLGGLGRKQDACLTWGQLERRFPDAPANIKSRVTQEKARLGCE